MCGKNEHFLAENHYFFQKCTNFTNVLGKTMILPGANNVQYVVGLLSIVSHFNCIVLLSYANECKNFKCFFSIVNSGNQLGFNLV